MDGNIEGQVDNYQQAAQHHAIVGSGIRAVLNDQGVPVTLFSMYRAFSLQVDKIIRQHDGETRRYLLQMAVDRWTFRGLNSEVLRAICHQVFSLSGDDLRPSVEVRLLPAAEQPRADPREPVWSRALHAAPQRKGRAFARA